jgi:hypothetical protein
MFKNISVVCFCTLIFLIATPAKAQDTDNAWKRVIKSCAKTSIVGKEVLFFGPSNTIGLGSVWRKTNSGGYNPRFEFADLIPDEVMRKGIIKLGERVEKCEASKDTKWNLNVGLPFIGKIFKTDIAADFRKARKATVIAEGVALDVIKEVPFEQAINTLIAKNPDDPYLKDLFDSNRLLIIKGYRFSGLAVKLNYDPKLLEELKGKYPEGANVNIGGEKGLNVGINYSGESNVIVTLPGEVYIAGEFSRLEYGRISGFSGPPSIRLRLETVRIDGRGVGAIDAFARRPRPQ